MKVDLPSCIAGSKTAWDQFVRASAPVIYAAVRRNLRVRGIASSEIADRVQDVYVRLMRDDCRLLRAFDPARSSLVTWLTLISRTVVHEQARRKSLPTVHVESMEAELPGGEAHVDPSAEGLAHDHVGELPLSMLSAQQRQVIEMLFHHGLSVEQAAQRLGVEAQTIRSAKHKALTRLREHLGVGADREPEASDGSAGASSGGRQTSQNRKEKAAKGRSGQAPRQGGDTGAPPPLPQRRRDESAR